MRRTGLIVLAVAVLAWAVAAIAIGSPSLGLLGSSPSSSEAVAPSCLPATLAHSAMLAGTGVDVSPAPETVTANPSTQISFLGTNVADVQDVTVAGSSSGHHDGQLRAYHQGDGASFVPDKPFSSGERVSVSAVLGPHGHERQARFSFRVDTPYPTAGVSEFPNPAAAPAEYQSFETLPGAQAPILSVAVPDHDPAAGDILTTNGPGPGQYGALIYTPQGRLVWFHRLSGGVSAENLMVQSYEGRRDLTFWQGRVLSLGFGQGEDIVMNSNYQVVAKVRGGNGLQADLHDFQIAPHDVAYTTAFNAIRCNLASAGGSRNGAILDTAVQEIDIKTGLVRWEWHSLDHVGVGESQTAAPTGGEPWDWFHVNSIDPEPGGDVLISARNTWAAYQLQGGSGNVLWRLGGSKSSFKMGPGTKTAWQHDGRILDDGQITLFDDGSNPPIHHQSRALRIALDFKTHEAHLSSLYTHPNPLLAASQGNMQTLSDGDTLVGYGAVPEISEYAGDGSLLFDAHLPLEMIFYRAFRFPWSGRPLSPPAVLANLNNTSEETIVRMSWNGAGDVASWRVLAGQHVGALQAVTTTAASAFEDSTILPKRYADVAVQALDSAGQVLSTSPVSAVRSYAAAFPSAGRSG